MKLVEVGDGPSPVSNQSPTVCFNQWASQIDMQHSFCKTDYLYTNI